MLEGYGFGQQSYSMQHASWQSGYHRQNHLSGMPLMPNCYMQSPPHQFSTQQMMFQGNHAMYQDAWHAQNMHQNAWHSENMSPEKYGHFNGGYTIPVCPVASPGGNYLVAGCDYESFGRMQQVPAAVTYETMTYEHANWGGNGRYQQRYRDGFNMQGYGCQGIEWKGL